MSKRILTNDPQRQTCKRCGRPDYFNFHIPDGIWQAIAGPEWENHVLCLGCFDSLAEAKGIEYVEYVQTLYFAGIRVGMAFEQQIVSVRGNDAREREVPHA